MVYLVWGSAYKQRAYGAVADGDCPECGPAKPHRHRVIYKMRHFWYLARWVTDRRYANQCLTCGHATRVSEKVAQQGFKRPGIPLYDRWGWVGFLAAGAAFVAWAVISTEADNKRYAAMLAQPVAGDLYEIDLAKLEPNPQAPVMNAVVQVESVDAQKVVVRLPQTFYDGPTSKLVVDMDPGGAAHSPSYYGEDRISIARAQLVSLGQASTIDRVTR